MGGIETLKERMRTDIDSLFMDNFNLRGEVLKLRKERDELLDENVKLRKGKTNEG